MLDRHTKLRFLLVVFLALVLGMSLFRLGFIAHFEGWPVLGQPGMGRSLYLGLKFDIRWALILLMPAWLLLRPGSQESRRPWLGTMLLALALGLYAVMVGVAMVDDRAARPWLGAFLGVTGLLYGPFRTTGWRSTVWIRRIWALYAALALGFTLLAYMVDLGAYAYIHTRLNGTLLMFLENLGTSLRMVWQSYPVLPLVAAFVLLLGACLWGLKRLLGEGRTLTLAPWPSRILHTAFTLLILGLMWGKWSRYPLRWGEAFEAKTPFQAHAALNPLLFFLETRVDRDGGYDLEAVKASHALLAAHFGIPVRQDAQGLPTLARTIPPLPRVQGRPNVVFIQLESFAGFKTGILGNPLNPTPFFDSLCREGIFFDRFHVVMENTSRSMFATLFGTPDVSAVENATRNPLLLDQRSALQALEGYDKLFCLGGSANWAQIRGILKNTFKDLTLYEEGSWKAPVVDVWGVSDLDLLVESHALLAQRKGPFWAYIQTSGNHPPFTVPGHVTDFQKRHLPQEELTRNGFVSSEEFNSLRFMDHSLMRFFDVARTAPYFQNTVFVLWADHGISRGSRDARFGDLGLAVHHIPAVIYAPGLGLQPQRVSTIGSQLDLMPTVMSLLGHAVETRTLGRNLLDPAASARAAAFTFTTFRRPPRIGMITADRYLTLEPDGTPALFDLTDPTARNRAAEEPQEAARLKALAQGFHAWSRYLLSHNQKGN